MNHIIDVVVLVGFLILSFGIGIFGNKILHNKNKDEEGFFLAGRKMPGWLTGISSAVTSLNADVAPAYIGVALAVGLPVCWYYISRFSLMLMIAGLLFYARWHQVGVSTGPEFFAIRFGGKGSKFVRSYTSIYSVFIGTVPWIGAGILGVHLIFSNFFGYDDKIYTLMVIVPVLLFYVSISGYAGVLITDFIQTLVIVLSSIAICIFVLYHFGGPTGITEGIMKSFPESHDKVLAIFPQQGNPLLAPLLVVCWFIMSTFGAGSSVSFDGQRVISCKNVAEAVKVSIWSQLALFIMLLLITLPALGLLIDYPELYTADPVVREGAYSLLISRFLPVGLQGLTLAALAAAVMSTVSTHLSYGSQTLVNDVLHPLFNLKPEKGVWAGRCIMLLIMATSIAVVYFSDSLVGLAITLVGVFSSSALIGWGLWWYWRISFKSWLTANIGGPVIYFGMKYTLPFWPWWQEQLSISATHAQAMHIYMAIAAMMLNFAIVLVVTFLSRPESPEVLMEFYKRARPMGYWKPVKAMLEKKGELRNEPKALMFGGFVAVFFGAGWISLFIMSLSLAFVGNWGKAGICIVLTIITAFIFKRMFYWHLKRLVS